MPFTSNRRVLEPVSRTGNELEVEEQRNEFSGLEVEDIEMNVELDENEYEYKGIEEEALRHIESDLPPREIIGLEFKMEGDFERSRDEREVYTDAFNQSCLLLAEFSFSHNTIVVWKKSNGSGTTTDNSETTQSML